jgi:hypothetical protein
MLVVKFKDAIQQITSHRGDSGMKKRPTMRIMHGTSPVYMPKEEIISTFV